MPLVVFLENRDYHLLNLPQLALAYKLGHDILTFDDPYAPSRTRLAWLLSKIHARWERGSGQLPRWYPIT